MRGIVFYFFDRFSHDFVVIFKLQQGKHVRIVYLSVTGKCVSHYAFDSNDTYVLPVDPAERISESLRFYILLIDIQDIHIYLLCAFVIQVSYGVISAVCFGSDKPVTLFHRSVNIPFVHAYLAAVVF